MTAIIISLSASLISGGAVFFLKRYFDKRDRKDEQTEARRHEKASFAGRRGVENLMTRQENDIKYERLFFRHKEHPTEWTYRMIIRALCDTNQLWFAVNAPMPDPIKELETIAGGAIAVIKDDAGIRADIIVYPDGVRAYPVFTDVDKLLIYRNRCYEKQGVLSVGRTSIETVLKTISDHRATHIIVNIMHETQLVVDIGIAEQTVFELKKEHGESNDYQYIEGRNCVDKAYRLYFGIGVKKDKPSALVLYGKAAELFKEAAEIGNQKAQYDLGLLIRNGHGVEQDFEKAAYWLRKSVTDCDNDEKKRIEDIIVQFKFYKGRK